MIYVVIHNRKTIDELNLSVVHTNSLTDLKRLLNTLPKANNTAVFTDQEFIHLLGTEDEVLDTKSS